MDMHHSQEAHAEIREEVRKLCARFPGEYWRAKDKNSDYPIEFVEALTREGWLSALIPEEFGGSGLPLSAACAILASTSWAARVSRPGSNPPTSTRASSGRTGSTSTPRSRRALAPLKAGDLIAFRSAGAYGAVMAS